MGCTECVRRICMAMHSLRTWDTCAALQTAKIHLMILSNTVGGNRILLLWLQINGICANDWYDSPDSKVHGANMGPIWGRQDPGGPHVGHINFVIWVCFLVYKLYELQHTWIISHRGRDKIDAILETTLPNAFSSVKIVVFRFKFHWNLFSTVQSTIRQHWMT